MPETPPGPTATPTASHDDTEQGNTPQDAQAGQQQPQPTASTIEAGNVLAGSQAVGEKRPAVLLSPTGQPLARGPDGRLYNPAKGEPPPKRQSSADLKPLVARTYDDSPGETLPRERGIKGLDLIPKDWQKLPPNVSLSHEIGWVQSNRLAVVKELPSGGVKVDLTKAYAPAPSHSALGWLETSIRSYAKFIEVASKQASSGQDEAEFVRKERLAISEIRSILAEMLPKKD